MHFHAAADRRGTADAGAILSDHQVARAGRCSHQRHVEGQGPGRVAAGVGLHQAQALARQRGRVQVEQEGAVGGHRASADHGAIDVAHFDGCPGFTATAQGQAVCTDYDVVDYGRGRGVRRVELQRGRDITSGVHQADVEDLAIGLGRGQGNAEAAAGVDHAGANHVARGVAYLHASARLTTTGQGDAAGQVQAGRLCRGLQVWGGHRARGGGIAGGIGQHHLQGTAIVDRRGQGDLEGAIRVDRTVSQHVALGIAHLHAGARFATAAQLATGKADDQVGRGLGWRDVDTVDIWGSNTTGAGGITGGVGSGDLQHLTVHLCRAEGDTEATGGAHYRRTQHGSAIGCQHTHGAARFGTAGDDGTVGIDREFARGGRGGDIRRTDLHRQGRCSRAIDGYQLQQLTIGLGRVEDDGEGTFGTHHHTAYQRAVGIVYFHAAAGRGRTRDAGAILSDFQVAWAGGGSGQRHLKLQGFGRVAARVGLYQAQCGARLGCRVEADHEGAVGADCSGADDSTDGITYFNSGTGLAATAEHQAIGTDHDVADRLRRGDVRCIELQRRRGVAGSIYQPHVQRLAIGLSREQGDAEGAVWVDQAGANQVAGAIAHLHRGAGFAAPGKGDAIGQGQFGRLRRSL
ncbi:hypothetical protein D3C76_713530 [compost metagenome]